MHIQHSLPNILPPRLPTPLPPPSLPRCDPHVPTRVRSSTGSYPRIVPVVSIISKRPAVRQSRPYHESRKEQLPAASTSRELRRPNRAHRSTPAGKVRGV